MTPPQALVRETNDSANQNFGFAQTSKQFITIFPLILCLHNNRCICGFVALSQFFTFCHSVAAILFINSRQRDMSNQIESNSQTAPGEKVRKAASLPSLFDCINSTNITSRLTIIEELNPSTRVTDRGPHKVAKSITLQVEQEDGVNVEVIYELADMLTLDQLRLLCKKVRCHGYASLSKFHCCRQSAAHAGLIMMYDQAADKDAMTNIKKKMNSDLRKVNTFFHNEMLEQVKSINV
jgi:hypothetical protein